MRFVPHRILARKSVREFLKGNPEAESHLERVSKLIEGFETPYGMELLPTVHWVVKHETEVQGDPEAIRAKVESWNQRKKALVKPQHVEKAYERLKQQGWLPA